MRKIEQKLLAVSVILITVIVLLSFHIVTSPGKSATQARSALAVTSIDFDPSVIENIRQCVDLPKTINVRSEKEFYQILETSNGTFKILNAYYDDRKAIRPTVRIIAYSSREISVKTFCQIRFAEFEDLVIAEASIHKKMLEFVQKTGLDSLLISCLNPLAWRGFIPTSVSLVEHECAVPTNNLKIIYNKPVLKKRFGLIVKNFEFADDRTNDIIEWVETLLLLGVSKILIYVLKAHPNTMKTLKYYESLGILEFEPMILPDGLVAGNKQRWFSYMLTMNDCFYKHMYEYDFLAIFDVDELIVPTRPQDRTWDDLLRRVWKDDMDYYEAQNVYFLLNNSHTGEIQPEVPSNFKMLQHIYKSVKTKPQDKSFQNTETVILVFFHKPIFCIGDTGKCSKVQMKFEDAQMHHYRANCELSSASKEECKAITNETIRDTTLWKYKDEIIANFELTSKALKNFKT